MIFRLGDQIRGKMQPKILVVYYSRGGNTRAMAEEVVRGVREAGGDAILKDVRKATPEDLVGADGIVLGSPTYFGAPAAEMKRFIDDSIKIRGKLEGKVGAAFSSSAHRAGGRETTVLSMLHSLLVHGMVVCGDPLSTGGHYGAAADGSPDDRAKRECLGLGRRVAELAKKLRPG